MSEPRFFYLKGGQQQGPVSVQHLQQMAASGQLAAADLVWQEGTANWVPASQVPGLFGAAVPRPAPAVPRPAPAADLPYIPLARDEPRLTPAAGWQARQPSYPMRRQFSPRNQRPPAANGLVWLCSTGVGVSILAVLGVLFMCGGLATVLFGKTPTEPTKISIRDLEKESKPPADGWLEITDGVLYWDEMVYETTQTNKGGPILPGAFVDKSKIKWYFVPLISQDVLTDWNMTPRPQGPPPPAPPQLKVVSYAKARVVLKFSPSQMEKAFPGIVANLGGNIPLFDPYQPKGTVGTYSSIPKMVMDEMQKTIKDQKKDRMILLINEGKPISTTLIGTILLCVGIPMFIPLGIWALRRAAGGGKKPRPVNDDFEGLPELPSTPAAAPYGAFSASPQAAAAPQTAAHADTRTYYYNRKGQSLGPVSFAKLRDLAASGQLAAGDLVWDEAAKKWVPASNLPGLF